MNLDCELELCERALILRRQAMKKSHVEAVMVLAVPFQTAGLYDFGRHQVTQAVRPLIPQMLTDRLKPPPDESYSLHRKLSGAFLLCTKLRSRVPCQRIFAQASAEK